MPKIKHSLLNFVQNKAPLTVGIFFLIFGFAFWGLQFSRLELDIYDVYDPNFQSSHDLAEMKENFADQSQVLVAFEFIAQPKGSEVCKLMEWSRELSRNKDIKGVSSLWSIRAPKSQAGKLWYPRVQQDPCLMSSSDRVRLTDALTSSFFRHLISQTGTNDLVFDISFSNKSSDISQIEELMDQTNNFLKKDLPEVKVRYLGLAGFRYYFKKIIQKDSIYSALILLVIIFFMRIIFGTWKSGMFLIMTLTGTTVILYGVLALSGVSIDILANNLFLMTAVAGMADFIFVSQYQMSGNYQESFRRLIVPCFFTTFTTLVGFLSLNTSDLSIIQRFGNGAALGALVEWLMMFLFLPAWLKVTKQDKVWVNPSQSYRGKWIDKIEEIKLSPLMIRILVLLTVLSLPAFFYLNDQDSPVKNLPKHHVLRQAYEDFQNKFEWQGQAYLYFPQKLDKKDHDRILKEIYGLKLVYRVENPEELADEWSKGLPPLRQDLIRRELSMTPLWERYYSNAGTLRVPLYLTEQDLHSLRNLRSEVEKICHDKCRLAGQRIVYLEYGEKIARNMMESFAVSLVLVISIIGFLLWKTGHGHHFWAVSLSALMGPLITLTLIALFQIPVTLVTSIFLAVMVGQAGDNAIQFILVPEGNLQQAIVNRSRASLLLALVMILGSSLFLLHTLWPMKILGVLFIIGFLINIIGDVFGLKGLLTKS